MTDVINSADVKSHPTITLDEELLNIIASQVKSSPYAIVLSMSIVAYMLYQHIPEMPLVWGGWLGLIILTQLYRMYRLPRLPMATHLSAKRRVREAAAMNIIGIGIQSLSLLAFPFFTPYEAAVMTMIFVGMGVGSIVTAVGWAPYTLAHIWLTLVPMYGLWGWSGLYGPGGTLGLLVAIVGFAYSLTLWLISQRLYRMNEDFFANRTALALALEEAEAAGLAKTRFLAAASHDLRQPIHALALFSAALGMRPLDDRTQDISNNINAAVTALSSQLDALLDVSKLDAGVVPVQIAQFNLSESVDRLCGEVKAIAEAAGIKLEVECPSGAMAKSDAVLFERLLRNLLTNAVTHNTNCSVRVLVAPSTDGRWEFAVVDSGTGIPRTEQVHIFEEFYQIQNPERDRSKGLGLGLSIVERLSTLLELDMEFESEHRVGTRFRFSVPAGCQDVIQPEEIKERAGELKNVSALVVDDEPGVRDGMSELLELFGCKVRTADSRGSALAAARLEEPDIALVDYRLHGAESGLDIIASLRELFPELPAIIISGDTAPDRLREAQAAGIELLSKPVAKDRLYEAISSTCNRTVTRV